MSEQWIHTEAWEACKGGDIMDRIDAAIGCQQCGGPLGMSPSDDFCGEGCQEEWHGNSQSGGLFIAPGGLIVDSPLPLLEWLEGRSR